MLTREQKKPFVIWMIVMALISWTLLACAFVKLNQHQNEAAFNYIMVFLVTSIIGVRVHKRMARKLTNQ